jgi:putative two-component system response regulator
MLPPTEAPGPRILIVDDQRANVRLLEHTLRRAGYDEVTSTGESSEVASLHAQNPYDLILLDLQMPEMDGFAVMHALEESRKAHPVAILVISADATAMPAALREGADAFLNKPFRLPDVVESVRLMLKKTSPQVVLADDDPAQSSEAVGSWVEPTHRTLA